MGKDTGIISLILALTLSDKANVDSNKCIKLAAVHDLAESVLKRDIISSDGVSAEEKHQLEEEAIKSC